VASTIVSTTNIIASELAPFCRKILLLGKVME